MSVVRRVSDDCGLARPKPAPSLKVAEKASAPGLQKRAAAAAAAAIAGEFAEAVDAQARFPQDAARRASPHPSAKVARQSDEPDPRRAAR